MAEFLLIYGLIAMLYFLFKGILKLPEILVKIAGLPLIPFITAAGIWNKKRQLAITIIALHSAFLFLLFIIALLG